MSRGKKISVCIIISMLVLFIGIMGNLKKVNVIVDNKTMEYWTFAKDVEGVIDKLNKTINISPNDLIQPDINTKINTGSSIKIIRVEKEEITLQKEIPYKIQFRNDKNIFQGQKRIINKGQKGIQSETFLVTYYDGEEHSKKLIKKEITKEPITEVIAMGTKIVVQRAGKTLDYKEVLTLKSTAYTHTGNRTATGAIPKRGTVAVDPKVIPLGTRLYVDGYGFAVAEDRGGSIKGHRIDLFMETEKEALRWGTRPVRVYILN